MVGSLWLVLLFLASGFQPALRPASFSASLAGVAAPHALREGTLAFVLEFLLSENCERI
jgi:hypothetical protein